MNKLIKELALISGFAYEPNKDQLWVNGSTEVMISPGLEKFAELLINKCADLCTAKYRADNEFSNESPPAPTAVHIRKYFGIK